MDTTLPDQKTSTTSARAKFRWIRLAFDLILLWSFISAISVPLQIDNWPPAVFLSYPPRAPYILFAVGLAIYLLVTRILLRQIKHGYWLRLSMSLITIVCCTHSLGWHPLRTPPEILGETSKLSICLVTANTGDHPVEFADQLSKTSRMQPTYIDQLLIPNKQS